MNKRKVGISVITEAAVLIALAFALDFLQAGLWRGVFANGGSIGLSMLPLLILCYRRGFVTGLVGAFILSFLQMLGGVYAIASTWYNVFLQISLDYILAYPAVALAGVLAKKFINATDKNVQIKYLIIGSVLGGLLKFMCHFLAGILFWKNFEFPGGYLVYSLVYNGSYMLPNIIITTVLIVLLFIKQPSLFNVKGE